MEVKSRCFDCHLNPSPPEGTERGPLVDREIYRASEHGDQRCESCHRTVVEIPHEKNLSPVECSDCHRVDNQVGAPQLKTYREYERSVHGKLVAEGSDRAPRCQNCHGDHDILRPADNSSHVNKLHIAGTCGECHAEAAEAYNSSVHGKSLIAGNLEAPVCTDCHGEHLILGADDPGSNVARDQVVEVCSVCHEDITKMKRFGLQSNSVASYRESYHGVAYKFGSKATATCTVCHGHHDILGREDPTSRIHPTNVPGTCGQSGCHEGAGPGFAEGRVHARFQETEEFFQHEGRDRSFARFFHIVELAFIGLTTSVIFFMILYMALDLYDKWVRHGRRWFRYIMVVTVPLCITFWLAWKATLVFISKLHF